MTNRGKLRRLLKELSRRDGPLRDVLKEILSEEKLKKMIEGIAEAEGKMNDLEEKKE